MDYSEGGSSLPASAPNWATETHLVWDDADAATHATGDPTAAAAWHVMMQIPAGVDAVLWRDLVLNFVQRELVDRAAIVAWAVHALQAADGTWIIAPHVHLVVTSRYWWNDARAGRRHPAWIGSWASQKHLEMAWRRACVSAM